MRGSGLSQRDVSEFSLDSELLDLEAVVDRLGLETFALMGAVYSGNLAIAYAARHPERVSHLLLWCTFAGRLERLPQLEVATALVDRDWELFTEAGVHALLGWEAGERAHMFAVYMRECVTRETWKAWQAAAAEFDVIALLPQVKAPTLVLHRRQAPWPDVGLARDLASSIPEARLSLLEGESAIPFLGDMEAAVEAINEFLDEGKEAASSGLAKEDIHTILFTDVEGSTALTERLGDAEARELLREHERMVRQALNAHGGSEVKTLGDGFMTSFPSATKALECAIAMQRAFAKWNEKAEEPIRVRIGLNAGEPIAEGEDLYGTAINLAARITAQGKGGEILASEAVRQIVAGKKFPFSDRGETALRGFEDRVHIYQVSWRGED
jgi:class 3 adenylate cyclase